MTYAHNGSTFGERVATVLMIAMMVVAVGPGIGGSAAVAQTPGETGESGADLTTFTGGNELTTFQGAITFNGDLPQDESFQAIAGDRSLGIGGYFGYNVPNIPFYVGADLGLFLYGSERTTVPFSRTVGPVVNLEVETANYVFRPALSLRYQSASGGLRPYAEGLVGLNYVFTQTSLDDDRPGLDQTIATEVNTGSTSLAIGLGAGTDIVFAANKNASKTLALTVGVQYLNSGDVEAAAPGRIVDENGDLRLSEDEIGIQDVEDTSSFAFKIGLSAQF
jgi:hypothetical protein